MKQRKEILKNNVSRSIFIMNIQGDAQTH